MPVPVGRPDPLGEIPNGTHHSDSAAAVVAKQAGPPPFPRPPRKHSDVPLNGPAGRVSFFFFLDFLAPTGSQVCGPMTLVHPAPERRRPL